MVSSSSSSRTARLFWTLCIYHKVNVKQHIGRKMKQTFFTGRSSSSSPLPNTPSSSSIAPFSPAPFFSVSRFSFPLRLFFGSGAPPSSPVPAPAPSSPVAFCFFFLGRFSFSSSLLSAAVQACASSRALRRSSARCSARALSSSSRFFCHTKPVSEVYKPGYL